MMKRMECGKICKAADDFADAMMQSRNSSTGKLG